ncbi:protein of unknown function [Magnetospirillum sp. XM-1]|nr:protein of unknown function [Magnetospirillum sp. XM-1]
MLLRPLHLATSEKLIASDVIRKRPET